MSELTLTPASGSVGAYVEGVDLRSVGDLHDAIVEAWHTYGVLFFRNQNLDLDEQAAAAQIFGEPEFFEFAPAVSEDQPMVHRIEEAAGRRFGGISTWHTDATWLERPPRGSMLQAIKLPAVGGDTLFASASRAFENLSAPVRTLIDELTATHHGGEALTRAANGLGITIPEAPVVHPVVRTHPGTGARCLFVNGLFTQRINELTPRESRSLLPMLYDQFKDPEVQCRFHWEPGDVAIWDNRAVQHYACPDYDEARLMHRVVLAGDEVTGL
ncbi:MAG: TauD/TfdA dioxygenase family protein [Acidimicrobiales bacterium]